MKKDLRTSQKQVLGCLTHKHKHLIHTHPRLGSNFSSSVLTNGMKMIALMKMSGWNYLQIKNVTKSDYTLCSRYACLSGCF